VTSRHVASSSPAKTRTVRTMIYTPVARKHKLNNIGRMASSGMLRSVHRLLVTVSVVPSSPILVTLMKEVLSSF
jgi:hypothetical protein